MIINRRFGQSFLPLTFYITLRRTFSEWEYCLWSFERISYVTKILELKNIHCFLTYFALHSWILMIVKQKWWSWSESWFTSRHTNVSLEPEAVIFFLPKKTWCASSPKRGNQLDCPAQMPLAQCLLRSSAHWITSWDKLNKNNHPVVSVRPHVENITFKIVINVLLSNVNEMTQK